MDPIPFPFECDGKYVIDQATGKFAVDQATGCFVVCGEEMPDQCEVLCPLITGATLNWEDSLNPFANANYEIVRFPPPLSNTSIEAVPGGVKFGIHPGGIGAVCSAARRPVGNSGTSYFRARWHITLSNLLVERFFPANPIVATIQAQVRLGNAFAITIQKNSNGVESFIAKVAPNNQNGPAVLLPTGVSAVGEWDIDVVFQCDSALGDYSLRFNGEQIQAGTTGFGFGQGGPDIPRCHAFDPFFGIVVPTDVGVVGPARAECTFGNLFAGII